MQIFFYQATKLIRMTKARPGHEALFLGVSNLNSTNTRINLEKCKSFQLTI